MLVFDEVLSYPDNQYQLWLMTMEGRRLDNMAVTAEGNIVVAGYDKLIAAVVAVATSHTVSLADESALAVVVVAS